MCYNPRVANTTYIFPVTVRLYEVDAREEVSCANLFRYFEETAICGSAHFGFTFEWYRERGQFWVIRTMQLERLCAPRYLDALEIRTWVSSMARVRSDRNYEVRRVRDGRLLARGIANWVYVDAATMTPARIPPEIVTMFEQHDPPTLPPLTKLTVDSADPPLFEHAITRRAFFYETDSAQHTNNAVYVDWLEEAVRDALCALGYRISFEGAAPLPWFYRHTLEYARPARQGDKIEIRTRWMRQGNCFGEWDVEMLHAASREILLRARATMVWVNAENQLIPWRKIERTRH